MATFQTVTWNTGDVATSTKLTRMMTDISEVRKHHKGSSQPNELAAGIIWLDDGSANWLMKIYDGIQFIEMGTVDPTNHKFTPKGAGLTFIETATASDDAQVDFYNMSDHQIYVLACEDVRPSGDVMKLCLRVSSASDATSFYAADYRYVHASIRASDATFNDAAGDDSNSEIIMTHNVNPSSAAPGLSGCIYLFGAQQSSQSNAVKWELAHGRQGGTTSFNSADGAGGHDTIGPARSLRVFFDTGNVASGRFHLYGIETS